MLRVTNKLTTLFSPLLEEISDASFLFSPFCYLPCGIRKISFHSSFLLHSHSPLSWRVGFLFCFHRLLHVFSLFLFLFIQLVRYFAVFLGTVRLWCIRLWCIIINSSTSNSRRAFFLFWYNSIWWSKLLNWLSEWAAKAKKA